MLEADYEEYDYSKPFTINDDDIPRPDKQFNAKAMLLVFTIINLITYVDRSCVGVCLSTFEDVFDLTNFEGGLLGGAYMVGFIVASPIFAHLINCVPPFKIMGIGLVIWTLAAGGSGLATNFATLLIARTITGVGEASFVSIAPPFIDILAPAHRKSLWLSMFYCAIPVGYAVGAVVSGLWLGGDAFGESDTWRGIYIGEALVMIPFLLYCFIVKPPNTNIRAETVVPVNGHSGVIVPLPLTPSAAQSMTAFWVQVMSLLRNPLYMTAVLGLTAQTFTMGCLAYYGVEYVQERLGMSVSFAGVTIGGLSVFVGLVGTAMGGWLLDRMRGHSTSPVYGLKILTLTTIASMPILYVGFAFNNLVVFFLALVAAEMFLFMTFSPANSVIIWSVPARDTPLALALSVMLLHIFGDVASTAAIGEILDQTDKNWVLAMDICVTWLLWAVFFWGVGWKIAPAHYVKPPELPMDSAFVQLQERDGDAVEEAL